MSKNLDETVREINDNKELQRAQVALPLWPAYQPRRPAKETSLQGSIVA